MAVGALALTATLTLTTAACGDDKDPGPTADDTTTTTKSTTTEAATPTTVEPEQLPDSHFIDLKLPDDLTAEEREVAEAYRAALEAFGRALRDPTANWGNLKRHYTAEPLSETRQRLTDLVNANQAVRRQTGGRMAVDVLDATVTPDGVGLMLICLTDDSETYDVRTGAAVTKGDPPHQVAVRMVKSGSAWKVNMSPSRTGTDGTDRPCER